ncbi:MAG: LytTR family DNA-binding domain-containing protein [Minisyncoccia bacterium]
MENLKTFFFIKQESCLIQINIKSILYVKGNGDYVSIQTADKLYTIHSTMATIEKKLPADDFMRIHNSYIVRMDKIISIEGSTLIMKKEIMIPVSRAHKKVFFDRIVSL